MENETEYDWVEADRRHVWHPFTQMQTAPAPIPIARAEGVYLHTQDGRRLLDGVSSWWVNIHGHSHPRLTRALAAQASRLSQVIFAGLTHEPAARLAAELVRRAPAGLTRVFYTDDGSTAVEVAMKMAYQYWHNQGETQRTLFIALDHAYHGDTFGAMAAGARSVFHAPFTPLMFEVKRAYAPYCLRCPLGLQHPDCQVACSQSLEGLLERHGDRVAGVLIEPMLQGAGGMIVWPTRFLEHVRTMTKHAGVPLIADEVFTGFGRTGRMFACEHAGVTPDILCVSKAITGGTMPLAATLATEDIYAAFLSDDRSHTLFHGHSYTGNALACAVAQESLALFDEEDRLGRVARIQEIFSERTAALRSSPGVLETRTIGAMAAIELKPQSASGGYLDTRGAAVAEACLARGILLRPLGNVIYFLPPYVITDAEAHHAFDVIAEAIAQTISNPRSRSTPKT